MDPRPEGVYVTKSNYPTQEELAMYSTTLYLVERVNGNCTVTSVEVTKDEARSLVSQLAVLGVH